MSLPGPSQPDSSKHMHANHIRSPASIPATKARHFFHRIQPTFSVSQGITQLEFVDNSDPCKDVVVRKKAREWVARNREVSKAKKAALTKCLGEEQYTRRRETNKKAHGTKKNSLRDPSSGRVDPFDMLPNVGRKIDHIIEFYHSTSRLRVHLLPLTIVLRESPEGVSPSNDNKACRSPHPGPISGENTVLGTMAHERVSFVLWLHATTVIRDGMAGNWSSPESLFYYKLAIEVMKEESKRKVEQYSDSFLTSLACFAASANFAGEYKAAEMHRDAMVKALKLKGGGSLIRGVMICKPWARKAMGWCEIHVAAQGPSLPMFPYFPPPCTPPLPEPKLREADRLKALSLTGLAPVCEQVDTILSYLHQLSLMQSEATLTSNSWPGQYTASSKGIKVLYCAEYLLLQVLTKQKEKDHKYSAVEVAISETCQCYLWTSLRGLPVEMKMCDLFVARLKKALETLMQSSGPDGNGPAMLLSPISPDCPTLVSPFIAPVESSSTPPKTELRPRHPLDPLLIWALFIGSLVSSVGSRPEHSWFKEQLLKQILIKNAHIIQDSADFQRMLTRFPYTDAFCGLGIARLNIPF